MRVLVVGAGPTGLTLALALRRRGIACRLVEQAPEPAAQSRALLVQARTLEVLDRLGLADRLLEEALPLAGLTMHLPQGGAELRIDLSAVHPRFPPVVMLPQSDTERLLIRAGAAAERRVTLTGLEGRGAWLRHPDGRGEFVEADWIVGCDGAHSTVRHALQAGFVGAQYPQQLLLADCRLDGLEEARIHLFPGAGPGETTRGFLPMPGGLWRALLILPEGTEAPEEADLGQFAVPGVTLRDPVWSSAFRISRRQVEGMRHGHVLLAGDAAHIHSPVGGQGMNLGMQDAWALAAALPAGEAAVDAWATQRHAVAHRTLVATDIGTRMATAQGGALALARRLGFEAMARLPALRRRLTRALAGLAYPPPAA